MPSSSAVSHREAGRHLKLASSLDGASATTARREPLE